MLIIRAMKLQEYFEWKKIRPYLFCREHSLNQAMVYDFLRGRRKLLLSSAIAISKATNGAVSLEELNGGGD